MNRRKGGFYAVRSDGETFSIDSPPLPNTHAVRKWVLGPHGKDGCTYQVCQFKGVFLKRETTTKIKLVEASCETV